MAEVLFLYKDKETYRCTSCSDKKKKNAKFCTGASACRLELNSMDIRPSHYSVVLLK